MSPKLDYQNFLLLRTRILGEALYTLVTISANAVR